MTSAVAATFFGGEHAPAGLCCQVRFSAELLLIEGPYPQQVPAQQLTVRIGGANDDALFLNWSNAGVACSVMVAERTAQQSLLSAAPACLAPQLRRWKVRATAQRAKWNGVVAGVIALFLGAILVIWQSEHVETWIASQISLDAEKRLGESAVKTIKASSRVTQQGPAAEAVKAIGDRLTQGSAYSYQWFVKSDDSVNAFALPGGVVMVHTALLEKTQSAEELAGVLAHEVQHIEQRHNLQQMVHSAGWAAVLLVTLGDVSAISAVILHQAGNLRHARKLEAQADLAAVKVLVKAKISPKGMLSFFERMAEEAPDSIELLSSHPLPAERVDQIETEIEQNPCDCPALAYDWKLVQADASQIR